MYIIIHQSKSFILLSKYYTKVAHDQVDYNIVVIAPKLIKTRNLFPSDNYKYDSVKFHRTKVKSGTKGASGRNFEEGRITITFFGYSSCKFRSYVDFLLSSFDLVSCVGTLTLLFYTVPWELGLHQSVGMMLVF